MLKQKPSACSVPRTAQLHLVPSVEQTPTKRFVQSVQIKAQLMSQLAASSLPSFNMIITRRLDLLFDHALNGSLPRLKESAVLC
jgi:hypothetical protein